MRGRLISAALLLIAVAALAQHEHHPAATGDEAGQAMDHNMDPSATAMASHHMDAGAHMKMTPLRSLRPDDQQRAQDVLAGARRAAEKYEDYRTALNDGFRIFLPDVKQKMYHFTNYEYGFEAAFGMNPEHPTSLLYEKQPDGGYKLVGVMYTAPKGSSPDDLDHRLPLSIAQWHAHVNFCAPPAEQRQEMFMPHPKFGLNGSITTREACEQAGGRFSPQVFGWMVHVYPLEKDPAQIWSVERQLDHGH